jgi:hypothetical protein
MEARRESDGRAFPSRSANLVAMNKVTRHTMAHLRLDRAHLHPSLRQSGRRVLAAPAFGTAAKEHTSSDLLGFARPFIPSSPRRPDTRLQSERIDGWTSRGTCQAPRTTHAFSDLSDQARISEVKQDSDFPWEIAERSFDPQKISALRASGALRVNLFSFYQRSTSAT